MNSSIYLPIEGFPDYHVSAEGVVLSTKGKATRKLKPRLDKDGYHLVSLYKNGVQKTCKVHRLIAQSFILNPEGKATVNHKNGVKNDNRVENLEWATRGENNLHAFRILGRKPVMSNLGKLGKDCSSSKEVVQMDLEGRELRRFGSGHEASRNGFDRGHISDCCLGKARTHKGFTWSFAK